MPVPPLLLIGHSHLAALEAAQLQRRAAGTTPRLPITFLQMRKPAYRTPPQAPEPFNDAALQLIADTQPRLIVSVIAGNAHTVLSLIEHPQPFDFVLDEAPDLPLDTTRDILTCALVRNLLAGQMRMGERVMRALQGIARVPVVHLESPPPIPSEAHIRQHPEAFAEALASGRVTPAVIRHKLWRLHSALVRQLCAELGFALLPVPAAALDEQGFLRSEAWNNDPAHANAWYGELVLQQLAAQAGALAAAPVAATA